MKSIYHLFSLGSPARGGLAEDLATISRDGFPFGMLFKPDGRRLHRMLREECSHPSMFEIQQDGTIACPLLPGPLIDSGNTNCPLLRTWKLQHATNQRFCCG